MNTPVSDASVAGYAARLRAGGPLGKVFPGPISDCDFTEAQRRAIRAARSDKRAARKNGKAAPLSATEPKKSAKVSSLGTAVPATNQKPKALSKLRKMLYLQSGRCFFCGEPLMEEDASIEHLNPKSRGCFELIDR